MSVLPYRFFFRLSFPCRLADGIPREEGDDLLDLLDPRVQTRFPDALQQFRHVQLLPFSMMMGAGRTSRSPGPGADRCSVVVTGAKRSDAGRKAAGWGEFLTRVKEGPQRMVSRNGRMSVFG